MPLQLVYISTFIFLLLPSLFSTAPISKPGCPERCGDVSVPYPFGVGSDCSLDPNFTINCNDSTGHPKPYLSTFINTEVVEINDTYIRIKFPVLVSVCYDLSGVETHKESTTIDWSGTPYTMPYGTLITVIGCDVIGMENNGSWVSGGCSPVCVDKNDNGGVGYCPFNDTLVGNGCCQASISGDITGFFGAQLIDLSGSLSRPRLFPCSYAFLDDGGWSGSWSEEFSYPLYYLHNSTALVNDDNWASASRPPMVQLDWVINGAENCTVAQKNSSSYACRADKSICVNDYGNIGYHCNCVEGYEGNPYLDGGCKANSSSSLIAKSRCSDQCGESSIRFPFGIGPSCSLAPSFELTCNTSTNPPKAYLRILNAEIIKLDSSEVLINYPNLGFTCYNISDYGHGFTKTEVNRLKIDLSKTQYMLSEKNFISTIGCDDMLTGIVGQANRSHFNTSCASVCWSIEDGSASCSGQGNGCCGAPIRRGTTYLEANLSDLSRKWRRRKLFPCSFAFVQWYEFSRMLRSSLDTLNNSTAIRENYEPPTVLLEWKIGHENCKEARRNSSNYACQANSRCVEFDTNLGGYLCNCSQGYHGNPYLTDGCQDIDECAENTNNPCIANSTCINTPGSFRCICPKWYSGDGRKDGTGCIQDKSRVIISIGVGSGLGFLSLLLMLFWLYKMLQKRKKKMLKEKFFKRNGGMLLQQQTKEGALGKPKVFRANDLEVATDNFNESRIIGQGGQGTVYKGMLSDGKIVAIKKSKLVRVDQLEQFINEVVILSQISHRNVVKLLGCCLETEVPLLVYEFMPNGTLFDLIHDPHSEFPFPWNMRLKIAADIAGALAYLHSASSMPIYHRDIKSSNILLDEKFVVKVSDFGISKTVAVDQTHLTTQVKGTFGYVDPEYFQSGQFTEKSDVYSFGVVLVELLTGQRPISLCITDQDGGLAARFLSAMEENRLDIILDPQVLEQHKKGQVILLVAKVAQRCLNLKGKMRPTMKEVATELESLKISQMDVNSKDKYEEVIHFERISSITSDTDHTWTTSFKSGLPSSSSERHPLVFTT